MRKTSSSSRLKISSRALDDVCRAIVLHLEPDGGAAIHLAQFGLDRVQEILHFFLVEIEVAVARDAEKVRAFDLHTLETGSRREPG